MHVAHPSAVLHRLTTTFGLHEQPVMSIRNPIKRTAAHATLRAVIGTVCVVVIGSAAAWGQFLLADAPLSESSAWGGEAVVLSSAAESAPSASQSAKGASHTSASSNETELAKRVEALEETIRQMKAAAPAETLPSPKAEKKDDKKKDKSSADKKDAAIADECVPKKLDTIVKPTFTPTGRIYFDGVEYTDDPATKSFFHTDRDNELGFRTFRLGGRG